MSNGSNSFGVQWPQIRWISQAIRHHPNVVEYNRINDIRFDVIRKRGSALQLICLNEYTCTISRVFEVLDYFPDANFIYVGGNWNSYEMTAKEYCIGSRIGLYNTSELSGAFWREDFWNYHKKDEDGNPVYC